MTLFYNRIMERMKEGSDESLPDLSMEDIKRFGGVLTKK
jgi:hypothetical protein